MTKNYDIHIQGNGGKKILVIGCVHGDELIGKQVIQVLRKMKISQDTLITLLANTRAMNAKKRFIDQDLNRSFPGDPKGNHEEKLAHTLLPILKSADIVLDIHSTTTDTTSTIILTKVNNNIRNVLKLFCPKRVVVMEKKIGKTALTGFCTTGISFEYGRENNVRAYRETLGDIEKVLVALGMIVTIKKKEANIRQRRTEYFRVFGTLQRPTRFVLEQTIKNFLLVRKGAVVARHGNRVQKALKSFCPILFGQKAYKEIWGFMAEKVDGI